MVRFVVSAVLVFGATLVGCAGGGSVEHADATVSLRADGYAVSSRNAEFSEETQHIDNVTMFDVDGHLLSVPDFGVSKTPMSAADSNSLVAIKCDKCTCNMNTNICECTGCTIS